MYRLSMGVLCVVACGNDQGIDMPADAAGNKEDAELGLRIAEGLIAACPASAANDPAARSACADKLVGLTVLREAMAEPFLWGGQKPGTARLDESHTTRFNPLAWRKMYLSLSMFGGTPTIETLDATTVVHIPMTFRNELDAGAYPYPFWHSKTKWESYQYSTELLLFIEQGKVVGALRSQVQDKTRPTVPHDFNGMWKWTEGDLEMPQVTLYANLFSAENPVVPRLDAAYRALEAAMRPHQCMSCHSPDNLSNQSPLELLTYPNQALQSRRSLVEVFELDAMPPSTDAMVGGISDPAERAKLLELAKAFERAADAALAYEGERIR